MPAGESALISPGVPHVPFVVGPYEPLLVEAVIFGRVPFPCGRSLDLPGASTVWSHMCLELVCSPKVTGS